MLPRYMRISRGRKGWRMSRAEVEESAVAVVGGGGKSQEGERCSFAPEIEEVR